MRFSLYALQSVHQEGVSYCTGGGGAGIVSSSARAVVGQPVQTARFIKLTQLFPPPVSLNLSANHGYSQVKPPGPALSPP